MESDSKRPDPDSGGQVLAATDVAERREAELATRRLAKSHYENFVVASLFLPRHLRQPFYNVYAFCRTADDLADESPSPAIALERLEAFQVQLDDMFAGRACRGLFLALAGTVAAYDLPQQPFNDLLSAFRQDQTVTRYATMEPLIEYCRRSANPVGRIVLRLGGCFNESNAELSDQICTGLQLANFWQDVKRDFAIGRIYLPRDDMDRHGVDESVLALSQTPPELREVLAVQCDHAEDYLRRGLALAQQVPSWLSRDVRLFAHGGLATLEAIRRIEFDVLRVRPTVSRGRQFLMVARAMLRLL